MRSFVTGVPPTPTTPARPVPRHATATSEARRQVPSSATAGPGLVLAEKGGIDRALAYEVTASSAVAVPFVDYKRDAYERPDEADVALRIVLVHKDLELILRWPRSSVCR